MAAAQRRTTFKELVVEGLERVLQETGLVPTEISGEEAEYLEISPITKLPVLKRRKGVRVTDDLVNRIRAEEGI